MRNITRVDKQGDAQMDFKDLKSPKQFFGSLAAKTLGAIGVTALLAGCNATLGGVKNGEDSARTGPNGQIILTDTDRRVGTNQARIDPNNGKLCVDLGQTKIKLGNLCLGGTAAPAKGAKQPKPGSGTAQP
jgi:hypothetical protein